MNVVKWESVWVMGLLKKSELKGLILLEIVKTRDFVRVELEIRVWGVVWRLWCLLKSLERCNDRD